MGDTFWTNVSNSIYARPRTLRYAGQFRNSIVQFLYAKFWIMVVLMSNQQADPSSSENIEPSPTAPEEFNRKCQILWSLLKYPDRVTGEIADDCGFAYRGTRKYENVKRELEKLENETPYLEVTTTKRPKTRSARCYKIRRDRETIQQLYSDPAFFDLRDWFRRSDWLQEFLIDNQLDRIADELKPDMKRMLEASPTFFKLCLQQQISAPGIRLWSASIEYPIPSSAWLSEKFVLEEQDRPNINIFYNLFVFCMFKDYLLEYLDDSIDPAFVELLTKVREISSQFRRTARAYKTSYHIMEALIAVRELEAEGGCIPESLTEKIDAYVHMRLADNHFDEVSEQRNKDLDNIYNTIAEDLDLSIRREPEKREIADYAEEFGISLPDFIADMEEYYDVEEARLEEENDVADDEHPL